MQQAGNEGRERETWEDCQRIFPTRVATNMNSTPTPTEQSGYFIDDCLLFNIQTLICINVIVTKPKEREDFLTTPLQGITDLLIWSPTAWSNLGIGLQTDKTWWRTLTLLHLSASACVPLHFCCVGMSRVNMWRVNVLLKTPKTGVSRMAITHNHRQIYWSFSLTQLKHLLNTHITHHRRPCTV